MQVKDRNKNRKDIGVLTGVLLFCQLGLAPYISLGSGHPNFALVFTAVVALSIGGDTGVACGFAAGLIYDLCSTGPIGLMALICTITAFVLGMEAHDRLSEDALMTYIPFSVASLCVSLAYNLGMLMFGQADSFVDAVIYRGLPTAFLTIVAYVVLTFLMGRGRRFGTRQTGLPSTPGKHKPRYGIGSR